VPADIDAARLVALETPTLFIVGEHDPVAPASAVSIAASLVAGAKFKLIANSGHSAYFEQPAAFNQALLEFFATLA
jgi:3-oxoadipate enol-lactonase